MRITMSHIAVLAGLVLASSVPASTLTTNAQYTLDTTPTVQDGPHSVPGGFLASIVLHEGPLLPGGIFEKSIAEAAGFSFDPGHVSAYAAAQTSSDVSSMNLHSSATWSDVFTNTSGADLAYNLDYFFGGGYLSLREAGGISMFSVDVLLNGTSILSVGASLTGSPADSTVVLDHGGLAHVTTPATGPPLGLDVEFDPFADSLGLGTFGHGDSFELTYVVETWASVSESIASAGAIVGPYLGAGFIGSVSTHTPIPEPTSMALLGLGLAGLGVRRLRKSG